MSAEMISGPDLGGGYLHQLTVERSGPEARFIHHVQEGGMDAGGPPVGDPIPLGFALAGPMCPFGGRQCWHREYWLAESDTNRVRVAYNRWRFVAPAMLDQHYRHGPRPVATAIAELVDAIGPELGREGIPWYLGGSAGLWARGIDIDPLDIDLGTDREGARRISDRLGPYLIEPYARTFWPVVGNRWAARAFLGTVQQGMRVEWSTPATEDAPRGSQREWAVEGEGFPVETIEWNGRKVPVSPAEFALVRCAERGRWDRVEVIVRRLPPTTWDTSRLERLLTDRTMPAEAVERVRATLAQRVDGGSEDGAGGSGTPGASGGASS